MLQRMNAAAQKGKGRNPRKPSRDQQEVIDYSYINRIDPPVAGKVDHHSIELTWVSLNETEAIGENRLKYELQEEGNTRGYKTVYIGYSDAYKVVGLYPLRSYKYRLIVSSNEQQLATSPSLTVCTSDEPYDADQLHKAVLKNDALLLEKILKSGDVDIDACDKYGLTPLMVATQKGLIEMVEYLLQNNADTSKTDTSGKNSLMLACFSGNEAVARRLRSAGLQWDTRDRSGSTCLHYAVDSCSRPFVQWVMSDGAEIEDKDGTSGWTPLLRCAATTGDAEVAGALLDSGANVNTQDNSGKSALMMSCLNGHLRLTRLLLERGANIHLRSLHGKTCMDMASSFDRQAIVTCLETALDKEQQRNVRA